MLQAGWVQVSRARGWPGTALGPLMLQAGWVQVSRARGMARDGLWSPHATGWLGAGGQGPGDGQGRPVVTSCYRLGGCRCPGPGGWSGTACGPLMLQAGWVQVSRARGMVRDGPWSPHATGWVGAGVQGPGDGQGRPVVPSCYRLGGCRCPGPRGWSGTALGPLMLQAGWVQVSRAQGMVRDGLWSPHATGWVGAGVQGPGDGQGRPLVPSCYRLGGCRCPGPRGWSGTA